MGKNTALYAIGLVFVVIGGVYYFKVYRPKKRELDGLSRSSVITNDITLPDGTVLRKDSMEVAKLKTAQDQAILDAVLGAQSARARAYRGSAKAYRSSKFEKMRSGSRY